MKKVLDRKYAKDIKELFETEGFKFKSYVQVTKHLQEKYELENCYFDAQIRALMLLMKDKGLIKFETTKRGRPSGSKSQKKKDVKKEILTKAQVLARFGLKSKVTPKAEKTLIEEGFVKVKAEIFPFAVQYVRG